MEHLSNCHGEWNALLAVLYSAPVVGVWLRLRFLRKKGDKEDVIR